MKSIRLLFGLATLAMGVASAASSYKVTIPSDTSAGDTQLKAGDYKVQVEGNQATFTHGKETFKVAASVEQTPNKFAETTLESSGTKLQAIDIGGTNTRIVFQ